MQYERWKRVKGSCPLLLQQLLGYMLHLVHHFQVFHVQSLNL